MAMIYPGRMTAAVEEDFVVFLIGMRINKFWKVHKWLPVARSMLRMLDELYEHPELGLLGHEQWIGRTTVMMQYWKSFIPLLPCRIFYTPMVARSQTSSMYRP